MACSGLLGKPWTHGKQRPAKETEHRMVSRGLLGKPRTHGKQRPAKETERRMANQASHGKPWPAWQTAACKGNLASHGKQRPAWQTVATWCYRGRRANRGIQPYIAWVRPFDLVRLRSETYAAMEPL